MEPLKQDKLSEEARKLFKELEGREAQGNMIAVFSDENALKLIKKAIERGYELGYDKFHVELCEKCNYNRATCFGPGAFCDECSMEDFDEEEEE